MAMGCRVCIEEGVKYVHLFSLAILPPYHPITPGVTNNAAGSSNQTQNVDSPWFKLIKHIFQGLNCVHVILKSLAKVLSGYLC